MANKDLKQLYQEKWEPLAYLDIYSENLLEFDKFLCAHLFKAFDQGKLVGPRCIDVGAGPLVHRLGYASRVCELLVHSDFTDTNRELAKQWQSSEDLDVKHKHLFKFAAGLEGFSNTDDGAKEIESRLRSKLKSVIPIDILNSQPIGDLAEHGGHFDCAFSSACIEAACTSYAQYVQALKNIGTLLKPGAGFALMGFLNGDFYKIASTTYPCLNWDAEMVQKGLEEAGYRLDYMDVCPTPEELLTPENVEQSNCKDTFFCLAYKL